MNGDLLTTIRRLRGDDTEAPTVPINPLLAASIMANQQLRERGIMERAATEHTKAQQEQSVTVKGDRVTIKNAPTRDYLGEATNEIAESAAATHALLQDNAIYTKDPNDPALRDGVTGFRENYQARREFGDNPIIAAVKGLLTQGASKIGLTSPEKIAERVRTHRSARDIEARKAIEFIENSRRAEERLDRLEENDAKKEFEAERRRQAAQEALARKIISGTDLNQYESEEAMLTDIAGQSEMETLPDSLRAFAIQRRGQDIEKYAVAQLDKLRAQNKAHLAPTQLRTLAESYMGRPLKPAEWDILQADHTEERKVMERLNAKIQRATEEKPAKLRDDEVTYLPVNALVEMLKDPLVDRSSAKRAIQTRYGRLYGDRRKLNERHQQVIAEHASVNKRIASLNSRLAEDEDAPRARASLDRLESQQMALESEARGINMRLAPIIADMDALAPVLGKKKSSAVAGRTPNAPQIAPVVGNALGRKAPPLAAANPAPGPGAKVPTPTFAPELESGITAYMQATGYSRDKAVKELQAAGRLPK